MYVNGASETRLLQHQLLEAHIKKAVIKTANKPRGVANAVA